MEKIIFYFFAAGVIIPAFSMIFTKNLLYLAGELLLVFLSVAGIYFISGAEFLAVTQIVVYIGGILILWLFAIMYSQRKGDKNQLITEHSNKAIALMTLFFLLFVGYRLFSLSKNIDSTQLNNSMEDSVSDIGIILMTDYLLAFEMIAILLLVVLIGTVFIAARKIDKK